VSLKSLRDWCYYAAPALVNLYDDRGAEVSTDSASPLDHDAGVLARSADAQEYLLADTLHTQTPEATERILNSQSSKSRVTGSQSPSTPSSEHDLFQLELQQSPINSPSLSDTSADMNPAYPAPGKVDNMFDTPPPSSPGLPQDLLRRRRQHDKLTD
jgi:hypothetical protein